MEEAVQADRIIVMNDGKIIQDGMPKDIFKQKENLKKQRESNLEMKEYRLSVSIDVHDFNTRVNNSKKYLEKGHKVNRKNISSSSRKGKW